MPEEEYRWLPRDSLLRFEEIAELVDAFLEVGVEHGAPALGAQASTAGT